MAAFFGLHVGSSSISIAVSKDKKGEVLANDAGDRVIPAFISYNEGEMAGGIYSSRNSNNIMSHCKSLLGHDDVENEDVQLVQKRCSCKIVKSNQRNELAYEVTNATGNVAATIGVKQVLELLYKQLMDTAMRHVGERGESFAVLAVPMEFSAEQKQLMKDAACSSGFKVLQVINESSAAILACQLDENGKKFTAKKIAVVYRAGGTSVTVTVFSIFNDYYQVLSSVTRRNFGGEDVTNLIVDHLCESFERTHRKSIRSNARSLHKLRCAAEECKKILSSVATANCSVESLYEGIDFLCNLSRARLDSMLGSLMLKFLDPVYEVLRNCKLENHDINILVLCGGTCKIPRLQQTLSEYFTEAEILHKQFPDEVLATGAAYQAENFKGLEDNDLDEEFSVSTITKHIFYKFGDEMNKILVFEKGTAVPIEKHDIISTEENSGVLYILEVTDFQSIETENILAKVSLEDINNEPIKISFRATLNNTIEVSLTSKNINQCFTIF